MSEGTLGAQLSALRDAGLLVSKWEMSDGKPLYVRRIVVAAFRPLKENLSLSEQDE
jgi:hypothetical protein